MNDIYKSLCIYGFLLVCLIVYYLLGLLFLVENYTIWKLCDNDSLLWEYVLVSLILLLIPKVLIVNNANNSKWLCNSCCLGIDLSLIIWGFYELYFSNLCDGLENSRLWSIGFSTLLVNIVWIIIIFMSLCLNNMDTSNFIIKENRIRDLDNVIMVSTV